MAFRVIVSNITCANMVEEVWDVFERLHLGPIVSIECCELDIHEPFHGFTILFSSVADNIFAKHFYERLVSDNTRKQSGESVVYPRVIYGTNRDGSDKYWNVYLSDFEYIFTNITLFGMTLPISYSVTHFLLRYSFLTPSLIS